MQRNKYLEDLGISIKNHGSHFIKDRKIKQFIERRKYGFDCRQIVNMDIIFAEWLYSRLMMYKEQTMDDLTFNSVEFEGGTYTIEQSIDKILSDTKEYLIFWDVHSGICDWLDNHNEAKQYQESLLAQMQSATRLWAEIMPFIDLVSINNKALRKFKEETNND